MPTKHSHISTALFQPPHRCLTQSPICWVCCHKTLPPSVSERYGDSTGEKTFYLALLNPQASWRCWKAERIGSHFEVFLDNETGLQCTLEMLASPLLRWVGQTGLEVLKMGEFVPLKGIRKYLELILSYSGWSRRSLPGLTPGQPSDLSWNFSLLLYKGF